jgi:hypothetical protein
LYYRYFLNRGGGGLGSVFFRVLVRFFQRSYPYLVLMDRIRQSCLKPCRKYIFSIKHEYRHNNTVSSGFSVCNFKKVNIVGHYRYQISLKHSCLNYFEMRVMFLGYGRIRSNLTRVCQYRLSIEHSSTTSVRRDNNVKQE